MSSERIRLVVLFGGRSAEHDVSCTTAAHVLRAADPQRYDVVPVGIGRDGAWAIATDAADALVEGAARLPARLDPSGAPMTPTNVLADVSDGRRTVVLPLLHGPMGEDGTVQGLLELADVAYVGSGVLGSAVAMDKGMAKEVLAAAGIAQVRHRVLFEHQLGPDALGEVIADLIADLGLPLFVKPANMGSSVGVSKATTGEGLRRALDVAAAYDEVVVVEEAVNGREIEVAVLGNHAPEASAPGEIVPGEEFYSYDDKYLGDRAQLLVPAPLDADETAEVRSLALRAFGALRCAGLARVDFFLERTESGEGRGFLCNEVNTMPGFTPISMYPKLWIHSGLSYGELIDRLVELAIERHRSRRRNTSR